MLLLMDCLDNDGNDHGRWRKDRGSAGGSEGCVPLLKVRAERLGKRVALR